MKIAAAQFACVLGDVEANLAKMRAFAARAKGAGAELIVFPEMADTGYAMPMIERAATAWTEGAVPGLQQIAESQEIAIISGVAERAGGCVYNAQVLVDAQGTVRAKYRKAHLFAPPPVEEHKCFTPGSELTSCPWGDLRLGLTICYDLRFPELYRALAVRHETNVFILSSAWPFPRAEHLRVLAVARAIENQSYMVTANRVGKDMGVNFCGGSMIVDPYGVTVAAAAPDREEMIMAEVSGEVIASVRSRMAVFTDRRPELY